MQSTELLLISIARALVEVAGFVLLGQGLLFLLSGNKRHENFVYKLFQIITNPVVKAVRFVTPRFVADQHIPLATFFLLFWLWIGLAIARNYVCVTQNLVCR